MTPSPQVPDLGILLGLAYQGFVVELHDHLAERGLSDLGSSDGYVFRVLGDGPVNISELARQLRVSKQGAAQIVDDMEHRGLVERRPDPTDGRARMLHLTDAGRRALGAARRFHARYESRLEKALGVDTVVTLRRALAHMAGEGELHDARIRALYL